MRRAQRICGHRVQTIHAPHAVSAVWAAALHSCDKRLMLQVKVEAIEGRKVKIENY